MFVCTCVPSTPHCSNPQTLEEDVGRDDAAKLWFDVLDKIVAAQRETMTGARVLTAARTTEVSLKCYDFGTTALA